MEANKAWLPLEDGEWVIQDELGFYPCKDVVFSKKYHRAFQRDAELKTLYVDRDWLAGYAIITTSEDMWLERNGHRDDEATARYKAATAGYDKVEWKDG